MKRDAAQTIFRTVVFAGAMLGAGACGKKPAPAAPTNTTTEPGKSGDPAMMKGEDKPKAGGDPCAGADPCSRPRGTDDDGGGGAGRGFILS
jgi:hypothetical protein